MSFFQSLGMIERGRRDTGVRRYGHRDATFYNGHDELEGCVPKRRVGRIDNFDSDLGQKHHYGDARCNTSPGGRASLRQM